MDIRLKRAYEPADPQDGFRVLVDRLWPRGVAKTEAHIDLWLKEIAPTTVLRKWFNHDPDKWPEFQKRYAEELDAHPDEIATLLEHARNGRVTLIYSAKDQEHNDAVVLKAYLADRK